MPGRDFDNRSDRKARQKFLPKTPNCYRDTDSKYRARNPPMPLIEIRIAKVELWKAVVLRRDQVQRLVGVVDRVRVRPARKQLEALREPSRYRQRKRIVKRVPIGRLWVDIAPCTHAAKPPASPAFPQGQSAERILRGKDPKTMDWGRTAEEFEHRWRNDGAPRKRCCTPIADRCS